MVWKRVIGLLLASGIALPAMAEGGSYPSMQFLLGVALLYTLGMPIAVAALAFAVLKLTCRQTQFRIKVLFVAGAITWGISLTLYLVEIIKFPFNDDVATILGGALSLGVAVVFGVWMAPAKTTAPVK